MSAADAKKAAVSVGFQLREQGVKEGDLVVVDPSNELEMVPAMFGVWAARAGVLVVDTAWTENDRADIKQLLTPAAWWGPNTVDVVAAEGRGAIASPGAGTAYVEWRGVAADYLIHTSEDVAHAIASRPLVALHGDGVPPDRKDGGATVGGGESPIHGGSRLLEAASAAAASAQVSDLSGCINGMPPAPSPDAQITAPARSLDTPAKDPLHPTDDGPFAIGCRLSCHTGILTLLRALLSGRAVMLSED